MMLHNSHLPLYRSPLGPAAAGSRITIRFFCDDADTVILRTWMGQELAFPMVKQDGSLWVHELQVPNATGHLWYDFIVLGPQARIRRYGAPGDGLGGEGQEWPDHFHAYQLTVYQPSYRTPAFLHGANIYQIFPDRFFKAPTAAVDTRTDRRMHKDWLEKLYCGTEGESEETVGLEFYGGTLTGIEQKLPELKQMGIDVLYLNPIFKSLSNHRYDTGDYTRIDPLLGTEAEFRSLCRHAKELGMSILLDGVFSHTGEDSLYFNHFGNYPGKGACQGEDSPYYRWYTFEHFPDKYKCWWGFKNLPEVNKENPDYQNFMFNSTDGIVSRWIREGASGWRLDVADELSMDFLRKLRKTAKAENPEAVVLGEVWEDASNKTAYGEVRCYCTGDTLDSVMNYPLRRVILDFVTGKIDAQALVRLVEHQEEVYPPQFRYSLMNLLGSHDRARVLNNMVDKDGQGLSRREQAGIHLSPSEYVLAVKRFKVCLDLLCALPGCPTLYYGDEAGMTGCADPFCRRPYPWGHEDKDLRSYVSARFRHRQQSEVLRVGLCSIQALDADTVRITRYLDGTRDALGNPTDTVAQEVYTIHR